MANSATTVGGGRRRSIIETAQRLAVKCGYSGFTVDDLAEAVGCSRRTLFNHVTSKEEAVLGALPEVTDAQVGMLREGGPTGDLVDDLTATIVESLGGDDATAEDWRRLHDIVQRNPELLARIHAHVEELGEDVVTHLTVRDGVDAERAWLTLRLVGGVVGQSVQDLLDHPTGEGLADRVRHNLDLARELLTARG